MLAKIRAFYSPAVSASKEITRSSITITVVAAKTKTVVRCILACVCVCPILTTS